MISKVTVNYDIAACYPLELGVCDKIISVEIMQVNEK